jgi:nucleoside-diphosphate-sugar epimerase
MSRVLVTGASGFLGSHISEAAHDAGYEVHVLIRQTSSRRWLKHDWLNIHVANLDDRCGLSGALKGMDAVIHNAGATSGYSKEILQRVNIEATKVLAEESIKAGVKRFVYISSQAAGGPGTGPFQKTEDDPDCPVSAYGRSKKKAEELLYSLRDKIEVVSLRYPAIYGPRGTETLRIFRILQGPLQPIMGLEPLYTSMVYVEGMRIRLPFWLVSLAAWWTHEVRGEQTSFTREKVREFKARYWLASSERAMRELGWRPQVLPQEGFAKTIRWYRYKRWL